MKRHRHFRRSSRDRGRHELTRYDPEEAALWEEKARVTVAGEVWPFLQLLLHRSLWILLGTGLMALLGFWGGLQLWQTYYTASAKLMRIDLSNIEEFFKPQQQTAQAIATQMKSPDMLQSIGSRFTPPVPPGRLAKQVGIAAEYDTDIIVITASGKTPQAAVDLANLYGREASTMTIESQQEDARGILTMYRNQWSDYTNKIFQLGEALRKLPPPAPAVITNSLELDERVLEGLYVDLQKSEQELEALRGTYTDKWPQVIAKMEEVNRKRESFNKRVESLKQKREKEPKKEGTAVADVEVERRLLEAKLGPAEDQKTWLESRMLAVEKFAESAPGYYKVFSQASLDDVDPHPREIKVAILTVFAGLVGFGLSVFLVLSMEFFDDRIKTPADVKRVTQLPLLASLGNLQEMGPNARSNWAFRTWTVLQHRLSRSPNHGLVCGITSSRHGEGCSTWIRELAQAASQRGFKVLTIAAMPSEKKDPVPAEVVNGEGGGNGHADLHDLNGKALEEHEEETHSLMASVLSSPAQVTEKLTGQDSQPLVHIPLPGWVWNLERRKQWNSALNHWRKIDNIVILVELPPASMPESVLLAENIPNLIWLCDSGMAKAADTRVQLETLRHARCNLVGAFLNHEPNAPMKNKFARWFSGLGGCLVIAALPLPAAESDLNPSGRVQVAAAEINPAAPAAAEGARVLQFSALADPAHRADWQKRLTLGPGDVLNVSLFGQPQWDRAEVVIGYDGRLNYLQASVDATGLTVDELRERLNEALSQFFRSPSVIIIPQSYRSKKYYILGKVTTKGVFPLDRPITVIEAVARANGLETGILDRNSVELADLGKSMLVRGGKRLPVNFEKLFLEGDLTQNVQLEPEDYLYFPAANISEIQVLGEVLNPGAVPHATAKTLVAAIASRGGFTERAFKSQVLVVRGSLNKPETYMVNTADILRARTPDFKLEPRDIVFVNNRPWTKVEELLDTAAVGFLQSAVSAWTGFHVGPLINKPFVPGPK